MCIRDRSNALGRTADSVNALSSSAANMKESNATVDSTLKELLEISSHTPVSYTHLDVYKRQEVKSSDTML